MQQTPSVGRIVHYYLDDADVGRATLAVHERKPQAAMIVDVESEDGRVKLLVHTSFGMTISRRPAYSESPKPGCWSWPPRV